MAVHRGGPLSLLLILAALLPSAFSQCTRPGDLTGYDIANLAETDLAADTLDVTGYRCAAGFAGSPVVAACASSPGTDAYQIAGCEACVDGTSYADAIGMTACDTCGTCDAHGQEVGSACTPSVNTVCACSSGFEAAGLACRGQACAASEFTNDTSCTAGDDTNLIRFSGAATYCVNATCTQAECCEMWPGHYQSQSILSTMASKRDTLLAARDATRAANQQFLSSKNETLLALTASVAAAKQAAYIATATTTGELGVARLLTNNDLSAKQDAILQRRDTAHGVINDKLSSTSNKISAAMADALAKSTAKTALRDHQLSEHNADVAMMNGQRDQFESAWADQLNILATSTGPATTSSQLTGAHDIVTGSQTSYTPLIDPISG